MIVLPTMRAMLKVKGVRETDAANQAAALPWRQKSKYNNSP